MAITVLNWASLPGDLLNLIAGNLANFPNFIRFTSICKPWRLSVQSNQSDQPFLPMLLTHCSSDSKKIILSSITEESVYKIQMPLTCDRRFCGSSHGWLFMVDKFLNIRIVNPFLNKTLILPKFQGIGFDKLDWALLKSTNEQDRRDYFIKKAILLPQNQDHGGDNFEVLVIYGEMRKLAYLKSRNAPWQSIKVKVTTQKVKVFADVICHKGDVFAVNYFGALVRVDVKAATYEIVIKDTNIFSNAIYLVESHDGNLLLVRLLRMYKTEGYEVYKLSWEQVGKPKWDRIESIGEQALFLGGNDNFSISTHDFPQYESNSIYIVDNYHERAWTHYILCAKHNFCQSLPSIWFVPNLTEYKALPSV